MGSRRGHTGPRVTPCRATWEAGHTRHRDHCPPGHAPTQSAGCVRTQSSDRPLTDTATALGLSHGVRGRAPPRATSSSPTSHRPAVTLPERSESQKQKTPHMSLPTHPTINSPGAASGDGRRGRRQRVLSVRPAWENRDVPPARPPRAPPVAVAPAGCHPAHTSPPPPRTREAERGTGWK